MVVVPADTPVTIPVALTVARAGIEELHAPPPTPLLNEVVAVGQTVAVPVIVPAFGKRFTVNIIDVAAVPQLFVTVYEISVVPAATPVTTPEDALMVAVAAVPDVQIPPASPVGLLNVTLLAGHVEVAPVIVPALGNGLTVAILVAATVPQLLVTV